MHILFIHQVFLTPHEAGSTRHFELAKFLVQKKHRVTVIGSTVNYLTGKVEDRFKGRLLYKENIEGLDIIRAWTYSKVHKNYFSRFLSFISFMVSSIYAGLKTRNVDCVIACSPQIFTGISGWIISRIKKVPFVFEIRDLWPRFAIETGVLKNSVLIAWAQGLERFIYKRAGYFIINSPGFYGHLNGFGITNDRIFLIPNGVDTDLFKPGPKNNAVRQELKLNQQFVIMYAGAHGLANDLDAVIRSAELLKEHTDIKFLLVGDGKEKLRLRAQACDKQLENIMFVDAQPKERMPDFCRAADICLAILQKREAFKTVYPNKLFDYMASGRPTLLAIDGVGREVLEQAQGGMFVEPENPKALVEAVLELYHNRENLEQWGLNARRYVVEHFERRKIAEKLRVVLEDIVNQNKTLI